MQYCENRCVTPDGVAEIIQTMYVLIYTVHISLNQYFIELRAVGEVYMNENLAVQSIQ